MKFNYLVILILVIIVLLISSLTLFVQVYSYSCEYIQGSAFTNRDFCYRHLAHGKADAAVCDKITEGNELKDLCYLDVATTRQDPNICEKTQLYRNKCYNDVAIAKLDPAICDDIQIQVQKDSCRTSVISFKNQMQQNREKIR